MNWSDIITQITNLFSSGSTPAPIVPKFDGTDLALQRKASTTFSTEGELTFNGTWECYTIECPRVSYRGSHVCIPAGVYFATKYFSPDHGFDILLLQNVPNRTSIEFHPSNWAINPTTKQVYLLGCIAPGTAKDPDVIYNSKVAFAAVMNKIDWTKPIRITITD